MQVQAPVSRAEASGAHGADANAFVPLTFAPKEVPSATERFDFEQWKHDCSHPVIFKGVLSAWPLMQSLARCADDRTRLHYLARAFGRNTVEYTRVPRRDPFMGYDEHGRQNFDYALAKCSLSDFCERLRACQDDPQTDVLYARGGANALRSWTDFARSTRPLSMLRGLKAHGEGIWLGSGQHTTYLHQDAHFNFFAMVAGTKRVILYPLEAIADLYPTPFFGGIAGTTSSFVRPVTPDYERFPRFRHAASRSWVAVLEPGDLLCIPPCWWHHVEAARGLNLMINAFAWALEPRLEYQFEVAMRKSVAIALKLNAGELSEVRERLYATSDVRVHGDIALSQQARTLLRTLTPFMKPPIPHYWQKNVRCYYDHYIFQINGEPVAAYPERHASWARSQVALKERLRHWLRFRRGLLQMRYRYVRAHGLIP